MSAPPDQGETSNLPEVLPPEVVTAIEALPPEQRKGALQILAVTRQSFNGPIPSPAMLKEYNQAVPGLADRLVKQFEAETKHRHGNDWRNYVTTWFGQIAATTLILALIYAGLTIALKGHDTVASIIFGTSILGVATIFVLRQRHEDPGDEEPRPKKRPPQPPVRKKK